MERLADRGIEVLFNTDWMLKKPLGRFQPGHQFYVDDEDESGALLMYPHRPPGWIALGSVHLETVSRIFRYVARWRWAESRAPGRPDQGEPPEGGGEMTKGRVARASLTLLALRAARRALLVILLTGGSKQQQQRGTGPQEPLGGLQAAKAASKMTEAADMALTKRFKDLARRRAASDADFSDAAARGHRHDAGRRRRGWQGDPA